MDFDHEKLRSALVEGNIETSEDNVIRLKNCLRTACHRYVVRIGEKNYQKEVGNRAKGALSNVHNALATAIRILEADAESLGEAEITLEAYYPDIDTDISKLNSFKEKMSQTHWHVNYGIEQQSRESSKTTLYLEIFDRYHQFTGRKGNSLGGPLYRFAKACVDLMDQDIVFPDENNFRSTLILAQKRRRRDRAAVETASPE